ncbi:MFS transporter [Nakamurella endophytica]|uniref:MFS transporter n=1 Tax=Nakamurella endophytica TaxID=1748367 RepID=A0A917WP76_9ACTN|nr:MFS transporter [Nakamurella endophytica]GGM18115.1 MFS transporter [Nakamurella endophytica]
MTADSSRRRYLVLAVCCLGLLVVGMDGTIVNVALPTIRQEFGASVSDLQWIVDAYTVTLGSLLVLAGSTADRFGRRRVFQVGLSVFSVGSLLCSVAPTVPTLIAFRMLQAIGGSMLNPVAISIVTAVFTDPRERARAIGIWGGVFGLSAGLGPLVGGLLTQQVGWRAIFWINVPICVVAVLLTRRVVPESRAAAARRPDPVGQLLVVAVLALVVGTIIESPWFGRTSWQVPVACVVVLLLATALVRYERRRRDPLIDLRFFRSAPFGAATVLAVTSFASFSGLLFYATLYLQDVRRLSPLHAGLTTAPMALAILVLAPLSGRLVATRGPRPSLVAAPVCMAAGAAGLIGLTAGTAPGWVVGCFVVFAVGFGLVNAPITNTAVSGMPVDQAGVAAAVASTSRQVGASLGVAVVGAMVNAAGAGGPRAAGIVDAAPPVWWTVVGAGVVMLVLGLVSTSRWAVGTAARTARLFPDAGRATAPR